MDATTNLNGTGFMSGDKPGSDALSRYEAFMAEEQARTAAEQARRRKYLSETRVTSEALSQLEQHQADELSDDAPGQEFDPWLNLLKGVETRTGVRRVYDSDGNFEYRVRSRYLVTSVLGLDPERINGTSASHRLGRAMRALGWRGPRDFRDGKEKTKGYIKPANLGQRPHGTDRQLVGRGAFRGPLKSGAEQPPPQAEAPIAATETA